MQVQELNEFWDSHFTSQLPIAHLLKESFQDRWVRFHSLPNSKRHPDNESEYQELLTRQNTLLEEVTKQSKQLWVLLTEHSDKPIPNNENLERDNLPQGNFWRTVEDADAETFKHIYALPVEFDAGKLDALLRKVADWQETNVMIVSIASTILFHPYDGGVDIILKDAEARELLKEKFSNWLSSHSEGL